MLSSLYIKNVAVIEEVSIDFSKGFTVLTGETGAGKSIIIDSISAILGERSSKDLIRTNCDKAVITALFSDINIYVIKKLNEYDITCENNELQIYREIKISGKTICKANGIPITAGMLKEIGSLLISIQGQHDSYELTNTDVHREYIDNFGSLNADLKAYQEKYSKLKEIKANLDELNIDQSQKERRIDFLKYQIEEIEQAEIEIGEKEILTSRRNIIKDSEQIAKALSMSSLMLNGENESIGILGMINAISSEIEMVAQSLNSLDLISKKLRDIEYTLQDISSELSSTQNEINFSPNELEEIEERLSLLYRLGLKYGESEEEILSVLTASKEELSKIEYSDEKIIELSKEFELVKNEAVSLAKSLSKKRKECAMDFSKKVKFELEFLNMKNTQFTAELERTNLNSYGCDKISFLVSANLGESLKPLSKIASGGELSRIMLAIKTVLTTGDSVATMIFDEIDTGISGDTANKVGNKLKQAAKSKQLICITHLAQVAALSDNHLYIEKNVLNDKTFTNVTALNSEQKKAELTRIIGGKELTSQIL